MKPCGLREREREKGKEGKGEGEGEGGAWYSWTRAVPPCLLCVDGRQVTGLYIRILMADVGELGNPQRRAVTAQYGYTRGAWTTQLVTYVSCMCSTCMSVCG